MAELKTKATENSVQDYLMQITNEVTRKDCQQICKIMEEISKSKGKMWGRTGDWFMMGFSPRKANTSLYIMGCDGNVKKEILSRLGKHKVGKGCVYIKTLADINIEVLKEMCEISYQNLK